MKIIFLASIVGIILTTSGCVVEGGGSCQNSYNYYYPNCFLSRPVISTSTTDVYWAPPIPDVYYYRY